MTGGFCGIGWKVSAGMGGDSPESVFTNWSRCTKKELGEKALLKDVRANFLAQNMVFPIWDQKEVQIAEYLLPYRDCLQGRFTNML